MHMACYLYSSTGKVLAMLLMLNKSAHSTLASHGQCQCWFQHTADGWWTLAAVAGVQLLLPVHSGTWPSV